MNHKKIIIIVTTAICLFSNQPHARAAKNPTPLEVSLALLKCKLLQLAVQLQPPKKFAIQIEGKKAMTEEEKNWTKVWLGDDVFNDPADYLKADPTIPYIALLSKHMQSHKQTVLASKNLEAYLGGLDEQARNRNAFIQFADQYKNTFSQKAQTLINKGEKEFKAEFAKAKIWVTRQLDNNAFKKDDPLQKFASNFIKINETKTKFDTLKESVTKLKKLIETFLENRLKDKRLLANEIREKISKKWIRNAAIRVFNDPLRSFLEIVVNALDASISKNSTSTEKAGKFGMGFFSILSFLWRVPQSCGSKITLYCLTTEDVYKLTFKRLIIDTDVNNDDIEIGFKKLDNNPELSPKLKDELEEARKKITALDSETGTIIEITPTKNGETYTEDTIKSLVHYVDYLDFYPHMAIKLITPKETRFIGMKAKTNDNHISVTIKPERLEVVDTGLSMKLQVILTKLLIPSTSTKGGEKALGKAQDDAIEKTKKILHELKTKPPEDLSKTVLEHVELHNKIKSPYIDQENSYFFITVNKVVVVERKLPEPLIGDDGTIKDIVVHMPQSTQLTLARNELSIASEDKTFEKIFLDFIINLTIKAIITGNAPESNKLILPLYKGLKEWEAQSAAQHIKGLFSTEVKLELEKSIMENEKLTPMPEEFSRQAKKVNDKLFATKTVDGKLLLPLNHEIINYNFKAFEDYLTTCNDIKEMKLGKKDEPYIVKELTEEIDTSDILHFEIPEEKCAETIELLATKIGKFSFSIVDPTLFPTIILPKSFIMKKEKEEIPIKNLLNKKIPIFIHPGIQDGSAAIVIENLTQEEYTHFSFINEIMATLKCKPKKLTQKKITERLKIPYEPGILSGPQANVPQDFSQLIQVITNNKEHAWHLKAIENALDPIFYFNRNIIDDQNTFAKLVQTLIKYNASCYIFTDTQEEEGKISYFVCKSPKKPNHTMYKKYESTIHPIPKAIKGTYPTFFFYTKKMFEEALKNMNRLTLYIDSNKLSKNPTTNLETNIVNFAQKLGPKDPTLILFENKEKPQPSASIYLKDLPSKNIINEALNKISNKKNPILFSWGKEKDKGIFNKTDIEQIIKDGLEGNLIAGTVVIFMPDTFFEGETNATTMGLQTTLFARDEILKFAQNRNDVIDYLIKNFGSQVLQPVITEEPTDPEEKEKKESEASNEFILVADSEKPMYWDNRFKNIDKFLQLCIIDDPYRDYLNITIMETKDKKAIIFCTTIDYFLYLIEKNPNLSPRPNYLFTQNKKFLKINWRKQKENEKNDVIKKIKKALKLNNEKDKKLIEKLDTTQFTVYEDVVIDNIEKIKAKFFRKQFLSGLFKEIDFLGFKESPKEKEIEEKNIEKIEEKPTEEKVIFLNGKKIYPSSDAQDNLLFSQAMYFWRCYNSNKEVIPNKKKSHFQSWCKKLEDGMQPLFFDTLTLDVEKCVKVITENKKYLSWFLTTEKAWQQTFHGTINLSNCFQQMLPLFYASNAEINKDKETQKKNLNLSEKTLKRLKSLTHSFLGMYKQFFTLDPSFFITTYGDENKNNIEITEQDISHDYNIIREVLKAIENGDESHAKKSGISLEESGNILIFRLNSFLTVDFTNKISREYQREDLGRKRLYIPTFLGNNPLSLLCAFEQKMINENIKSIKPIEETKKLAHDIIKKTIELCRSPEEIIYIAYLLLAESTIEKIAKIEKKHHTNVIISLEHAIKFYIQEKVDKLEIESFYKEQRKEQSFEHRKKTIGNTMHKQFLNNFINILFSFEQSSFTEALSENSTYVNSTFKEPFSYPLTDLLAAHMQGKGLKPLLDNFDSNEVASAVKKINGKGKDFALGKISQCIEAGSEKNAIEACIIETLQNSIDVVRSLYRNKKSWENIKNIRETDDFYAQDFATITYSLEIKDQGNNTSSPVLSIHDRAGFDIPSRLLSDLMLPDFSNKTPQEGAIGDMGNGSFKLYQDAKQVTIFTRFTEKPDLCWYLVVKPQRNDTTKRVEDLNISWQDFKDPNFDKSFWGTEIRIIFKPIPTKQAKINLIVAQDFLKQAISATQVYLDKEEITPFYCALLKNKKLTPHIPQNKDDNLNQYKTTLTSFEYEGKIQLTRTTKQDKKTINKEKMELLNPKIQKENIIFEHRLSDIQNPIAKQNFIDAYKKRIAKKTTGPTNLAHVNGPSEDHVLFRISERSNLLYPSYITTAGIPFRPLAPVAREDELLPINFLQNILHGIIVDIDLAAYEPVQSRAQLNMNKEIKQELRRALFEAYFIIGIKKVTNDQAHYFTHLKSGTGSFNQLRIANKEECKHLNELVTLFIEKDKKPFIDEKVFFDRYEPFSWKKFPLKSFASFINNELDYSIKTDFITLMQNKKPKITKSKFENKKIKREIIEEWNYLILKLEEKRITQDETIEKEFTKWATDYEKDIKQLTRIKEKLDKSFNTLQKKTEKYETLRLNDNPNNDKLQKLKKNKDILSHTCEKIKKEGKEAQEKLLKTLTLFETNEDRWNKSRQDIFNSWKTKNFKNISVSPYPYQIENDRLGLFRNIITTWFDNKINDYKLTKDLNTFKSKNDYLNSYFYEKASLEKENETKEININIPEETGHLLKILFNSFIDAYVSIIKETKELHDTEKNISLDNKITDGLKIKFFYDEYSNDLGKFSNITNTIKINLKKINITNCLNLIAKIYKKHTQKKNLTIVLTDPAYNEYFNPPLGGEAPTFIHELEHARRNTNHEDKKASHGTGYILSPKSKPGDPLFNIAKFDDCANFWARYAAQKKEGLLDLWIKNVWNKIKEDPNYVRFIEDSNSTYFGPLSKIRELENTDKKALINKLIADIEPVEAIKPIKK